MAWQHSAPIVSVPININPDFFLEVARGNIEGISSLHKSGSAPDVDSASVPEDIWGLGGKYNFSSVADIDTLSSDNALDTQVLEVQGLDSNWDLTIQNITLNGQNKVTLPIPIIRLFRIFNVGNIDNIGTIYCYVDGNITNGIPNNIDDVRGIILPDDNQSLMAIFPIPQGKTGYLYQWFATIGGATGGASREIDIELRIRESGSVFRIRDVRTINNTGSGNIFFRYFVPLGIPEKSDIKLTCSFSNSNNTKVTGGFDILLVDN